MLFPMRSHRSAKGHGDNRIHVDNVFAYIVFMPLGGPRFMLEARNLANREVTLMFHATLENLTALLLRVVGTGRYSS